MSSKRKNTPTKLASTDLTAAPTTTPIDPTSDGDSPIGSDISDSESGLSLHIASGSQAENSESEMHDTEHYNGDMRPPNKKQRLLQSIQQTTAEDGYSSEENLNQSSEFRAPNGLVNNNILTKPTLGLKSRKPMDSVYQRFSERMDDKNADDLRLDGTAPAPIMQGIQDVLSSVESVQDKQKRLSDMINQLQVLQQTLGTAGNKVSKPGQRSSIVWVVYDSIIRSM